MVDVSGEFFEGGFVDVLFVGRDSFDGCFVGRVGCFFGGIDLFREVVRLGEDILYKLFGDVGGLEGFEVVATVGV